jgi:glycerophosphoryl diester phosphodiesterase
VINEQVTNERVTNERPSYPFIIGHRGAAGYAPENTLASLEKAYSLGVRFIEVDVMLTADDHTIIFHDTSIERCTNGRGSVIHHKWHTLQTLDAGSWFHPDFSQQRILHLKDLIKFVNQHTDVTINIEIKPLLRNAVQTAFRTVQLLKKDLHNPLRLILSSFDPLALKTAQFLWPESYRALNIEQAYPGWTVIAKNLRCKGVHIDQANVSHGFIQQGHRLNLDVRAYTVNDPMRARQLKAMNIDGLFTDRPAHLFDRIF